MAKAVIASSLVKAAMFGADANWGRILCAIGYSGADVDVDRVDVSFASIAGRIDVFRGRRGYRLFRGESPRSCSPRMSAILVELNAGGETATAWGCDLTYDYVKINGDYRT